jgi:hypothetical protein
MQLLCDGAAAFPLDRYAPNTIATKNEKSICILERVSVVRASTSIAFRSMHGGATFLLYLKSVDGRLRGALRVIVVGRLEGLVASEGRDMV